MVSLTAPYVSGFLAFRELPSLVDAVQRLREKEPYLMPQAGTSEEGSLLLPRRGGQPPWQGEASGASWRRCIFPEEGARTF